MTFNKNDIVQIVDETHHWYPCLIIIDEVYGWGGVRGYINTPSDNQGFVGSAYIRLDNEQIEKVGTALIVIE